MRTSTIISITLVGICSAWLAASSRSVNETGSHFKHYNIHPVRDVLTPASPTAVTLEGFLGKRCDANVSGWLLAKNEDSLLICYTHRPGSYGWQGEHVGKWIQAATLAWAYSGNAQLRAKLDRVVRALLATQGVDGYLGTYSNGSHWGNGRDQGWDVWIHKYNLIGLLTYAEYTHDNDALNAARKIGDLLIAAFGPRSNLKLNTRGAHLGMSSGSILEPIVPLYRATEDARYLQFAQFVVQQWETRGGSKLVSALTKGTPVINTANGKAYEMLSCLVGLCELYRATGDTTLFVPVLNAWKDITTNQLLPTGGGSQGEFWRRPEQSCGDTCDGFAEVCVTVGWLQLNQQLLRLTGDVRYADEMEKTIYNQLAAAQKPDGSAWSYFTNMNGNKSYTDKQTCCSSSGPRGWASVPSYAYMLAADGIVVNLFSTSAATLPLPLGDSVTISQVADYPASGILKLTVTVTTPKEFALYVRVPAWSHLVDDETMSGTYFQIRQRWSGTTPIQVRLSVPTRVEYGKHSNQQYGAVSRGPQVLSLDEQFNASFRSNNFIRLKNGVPALNWTEKITDEDQQPVYSVDGFHYLGSGVTENVALLLSPFSSSGVNGTSYDVWIPLAK